MSNSSGAVEISSTRMESALRSRIAISKRRDGSSFVFFKATLANSYGNISGAKRLASRRRSSASSARDSSNANAAITEASTTLSGIAIFANHFRAVPESRRPESTYCRAKFFNRQTAWRRRLLQNCHQLALKRSFVEGGPALKSFDDPFRDFLNRKS